MSKYFGVECVHGSLARSCDTCDLLAQLAESERKLEETRKESQLMKDQFVDTRKHLQASRQDAEEKKNKAEKELAEAKKDTTTFHVEVESLTHRLDTSLKELAEMKKNRQKVSITADAKAVIASMERAEKAEKELAEMEGEDK